ncbi:glycosyltransferase family 25 protein [Enterovibrio norvegicus]|uniref:glycosyltransferase family 25 protein n=1 Tax=Enterovibrio norvegicus TaxID=188144 RepID=UPI00389A6CA0
MSSTSVYVVSLLRSPDRRDSVSKELSDKGIEFTFFDAVDGHLGVPAIAADYNYAKRLWLTSGKMPSRGELGCYASHYLLWLKCISEGKPIVVCEDDIELDVNAATIIEFALRNVEKYGFIRLEPIENGGESTLVYQEGDFSINLMKDNFGGTRAYAISPDAASRLVKHRWSLPVDCFIGANYMHGVYSYQLSPCLVATHINEESTIQVADGLKTPTYRKFSRELYSGYKAWMLNRMYKKKLTSM